MISIVIPTFNRFKYLLNAIESVKKQTYKNIEIIVVNDCSSQSEYYNHDWTGIKIIHLPINSRKLFNYPCVGYVRNKGIEVANGEYIAFCDDDDIWFPNKLELQLNAMIRTNCRMSSTDGLIGNGVYDKTKVYKKYNKEQYYDTIRSIFKSKKNNSLDNGYPEIWNLDFIKTHNCIITSSVLIEKELLNNIGNFQHIPINKFEDYECWKKALTLTDCVYIDDVCFYYDNGHGDGKKY